MSRPRTLGGEDLLKKYGTRIKLAEALILGQLSAYEESFCWEILNETFVLAATARFQLKISRLPEVDDKRKL